MISNDLEDTNLGSLKLLPMSNQLQKKWKSSIVYDDSLPLEQGMDTWVMGAMNGEIWLLVTHEPVEFEK
jgi:hypothetical protein